MKKIVFFLFLISGLSAFAQRPIKSIYPDDINYDSLAIVYGKHKHLPPCYQKQILIALSYFPELKDVPIDFITKIKLAPLSTAPKFWSNFRKKGKRKFTISISVKSVNKLQKIILDSLNFNAQIGVIGHELSHVADLNSRRFFGLVGVFFGHVSRRYVDRFEFNTDRICIDHGLGYQLLAWSINVRKTLNIGNWEGPSKGNSEVEEKRKKERYMNPNTIRGIIAEHPLYK